jgi:hypothetical protein
MLAWKNYSNSHVIFDASAGTSPSGGAVNNTNSAVAWSSTYPTLMGWNGGSTYGVRVDSARIADSITSQANSATITASTAATANQIVLRDGGGDTYARYSFATYMNSSDDVSGAAITYVMAKFGDNYFRSATAAKVATFISGQSMNISGSSTSCSGNAATASSAVTLTGTQNDLGYSISGQNIDYSGQGGPQILGNAGGAAMMSFHRPGYYAINFGLGTDNQLRTGGWSRGGNYVILDAGNYTSYAPSLTGSGASGTWSINVTGSAGSASTATTATTANALATGNNYQVNSLGVGTAASGTAGEIRATNAVTAYYSDDRLKTKLGNIEGALAKVKTLSGFYYEANETAQALGYKPKREVGVSAQSVQAVLPEVVVPAPIDEQYLTVHYDKLVPLLIEAIKELEAKVAALEAKG